MLEGSWQEKCEADKPDREVDVHAGRSCRCKVLWERRRRRQVKRPEMGGKMRGNMRGTNKWSRRVEMRKGLSGRGRLDRGGQVR